MDTGDSDITRSKAPLLSRDTGDDAHPRTARGGYKLMDRLLRHARIRKARPYVRKNDVVLDVGCGDGELFRRLRGLIRRGVGIEPSLSDRFVADGYELLPGAFPTDAPTGATFDAITMLAVLEHIPEAAHAAVADACAALLGPGGRVIITVPSPSADHIIHLLMRLRIITGMATHQHYGFEPAHTTAIFSEPRFRLVARKTFQFRLNNLFVFEREGTGPGIR